MADDRSFLRRTERPVSPTGTRISAVDLFAGCGGLSVGTWEAARALGAALDVRLAVDVDPVMAKTFERNFRGASVRTTPVEELFPGEPGCALRRVEAELAESVGPVDLLYGGPPCQGHSDLNNHTRRTDSRNRLYLKMARAAEALLPRIVIVENVPAVQLDATQVVVDTAKHLEKLGYQVESEVVDLSRLGVPQSRRRHLLVATMDPAPQPIAVLDHLDSFDERRSVGWAIADLRRRRQRGVFDSASVPTEVNAKRIDYLFDHGLDDLPDSERPDCHRTKPHKYRAVYGRMRWTEPAPTITTGFGCMGQGRFVHPLERRTITPHEAARLQTFPDWFDWGDDVKRMRLATMIGNAVPPLLMMRIGEFVLPHLLDQQ